MKKLLLITLLFVNGITIAQNEKLKEEKVNIDKGTWSFGGQLSLNLYNSEFESNGITQESDNSGISINPEVGYAIQKNLIIGLGLGYSYFENENNNDFVISTNKFSIYPYVKKFIPVNNNLLFSVRGEVRFIKTNYDNSNSNLSNSNSDQTFFIGFRPGITYFISEKLALEANIGALGYSRLTRDFDPANLDKATANSFNFDFNSNNLLFGFTYFMN
jgi:long-subunit fatty acid transport protein